MKQFEKRRLRKYIQVYKEKQPTLDPEEWIHSPELYALWNLKFYLMKILIDLNPFRSKCFLYTDSGAWRGSKFTDWPDEEFMEELAIKLDDRVLFGQVGNISVGRFDLSKNIIQGTV